MASSPGATSRYARLVVRLRFVLVAGWVAAAVAATALLPTLEEAQTGALGDLVAAGSEAIDAEVRAAESFAFPLLSRTLLAARGTSREQRVVRVVGRPTSGGRGWPARVSPRGCRHGREPEGRKSRVSPPRDQARQLWHAGRVPR